MWSAHLQGFDGRKHQQKIAQIDEVKSRPVVSIDFYRLTDTIDISLLSHIDWYRFIDHLPDIYIYRLFMWG